MAQGEQNGNGWMVLWKMGSPKKSPESPAASETRWKATVAPPHSQGAGWTSSRERQRERERERERRNSGKEPKWRDELFLMVLIKGDSQAGIYDYWKTIALTKLS